MDHRIKSASINEAGTSLTVVFHGGAVRLLDLAQYAARGGAFAGLSDPAYARQFELAFSGYILRWPGGLDFCSDAVFDEGLESQLSLLEPEQAVVSPAKGTRGKARA